MGICFGTGMYSSGGGGWPQRLVFYLHFSLGPLPQVIHVRYNVTVQLLNGRRVETQPGPMVGIRGRTLADPEP